MIREVFIFVVGEAVKTVLFEVGGFPSNLFGPDFPDEEIASSKRFGVGSLCFDGGADLPSCCTSPDG